MKLLKLGLMAGMALSVIGMAAPALAEDVTITVWSIDGAQSVGPSDTFSKEFDEMDNGIHVEYRAMQFDEIVNETMRAFATGNAPDIVSLDNPDFALSRRAGRSSTSLKWPQKATSSTLMLTSRVR